MEELTVATPFVVCNMLSNSCLNRISVNVAQSPWQVSIALYPLALKTVTKVWPDPTYPLRTR